MPLQILLVIAVAVLISGCRSSGVAPPGVPRELPSACTDATPPLPDGVALRSLSTPPPQPGNLRARAAYACATVTINEQGEVVDPQLISTDNDEFARAFLAIIETWRFEPLVKDGVAIAAQTTLTARFRRQQ